MLKMLRKNFLLSLPVTATLAILVASVPLIQLLYALIAVLVCFAIILGPMLFSSNPYGAADGLTVYHWEQQQKAARLRKESK